MCDEMSLLAARLTAQLIAGRRPHGPVAVVDRLLAVQAQDLRGALLAVRARSSGLRLGDVERELSDERSLIITWLNRGTLHLVRSADYPWLQALTAPRLRTAAARRLAQEGVSLRQAERGVAAIERALAEDGPLDRDGLRTRVAAAGVRTQGQAFVHLLVLASIRGLIVRGPLRGSKHAFVLVRDWLGGPVPVDRDRALAELARRYLAGHGPASDRDLARWAGLPLRDARRGLEAIARYLRQLDGGLVALAGHSPAAPLPPPRLLGQFEPILLGWTSRELVLAGAEPRVISGGVFRPFALVRGRAAATWRIAGGALALSPFGRLSAADAAALDQDARDVRRFLGEPA